MKITRLKSKACLTALGLALVGTAYADDQKKNNPNNSQTSQQQGERYNTTTGSKSQVTTPMAENKASSLIGMAVKNQSGEKLGDIKDLALDIGSGRVAYAVFGTDGKERLFAIPLSAYQASPDHKFLTLNIEQSKFEGAKGFDKNNWPTLNSDFQKEMFWQQTGSTLRSDAESAIDKKSEALTPTGKDAYSTTRGFTGGAITDMNKASKLIGMNVKNSQDEKLGEIKDLVIDLSSSRISYAVLGYGGTLGVGQKLVAVPVNAFTFGTESKFLVLNAEKSRLESAQGFDKNSWPSVSNPTWGSDKFWEGGPQDSTTPEKSNQNQNQNDPNKSQ